MNMYMVQIHDIYMTVFIIISLCVKLKPILKDPFELICVLPPRFFLIFSLHASIVSLHNLQMHQIHFLLFVHFYPNQLVALYLHKHDLSHIVIDHVLELVFWCCKFPKYNN